MSISSTKTINETEKICISSAKLKTMSGPHVKNFCIYKDSHMDAI